MESRLKSLYLIYVDANDFDIDEHASMHIENRGKFGIPSSVSVLVKDAEDIKDMLKELADAVKKIKEV